MKEGKININLVTHTESRNEYRMGIINLSGIEYLELSSSNVQLQDDYINNNTIRIRLEDIEKLLEVKNKNNSKEKCRFTRNEYDMIIYDTKTNLEWIHYLNKNTNWHETKKMIRDFNESIPPFQGGNWRLPKLEELKDIHINQVNQRANSIDYIPPVFNSTGWFVWCYEKTREVKSREAHGFNFFINDDQWRHRNDTDGTRAFLVREKNG